MVSQYGTGETYPTNINDTSNPYWYNNNNGFGRISEAEETILNKTIERRKQLIKTINGHKKPIKILKPQHKIKPKILARTNLN